uniref:Uncharacterized protein n=1 Tax=Arundo donax TaxID=35708 RepID=A0A0A8Z7H7_ARUDO
MCRIVSCNRMVIGKDRLVKNHN